MNPLSRNEVERLLKVLDEEFRDDIGWRIVVRALVLLGLESKEAMNFAFAKTHKIKGIYVHSDQNGRLRHIPIPKDMLVLITLAQQAICPNDRSSMFVKVSKSDLCKTVRYIGDKVGISNLTPYRLKWTAIYGD